MMRKERLAKEISVTLVIKLLLLWLLWFTFFRQPLAGRLTDEGVGNTLFGPAQTTPLINPPFTHPKEKEPQ